MSRAALALLAIVLAGTAGADSTGESLLDQAEGFYTGQTGRVDEDRARELFQQAAALEEPRAQVTLATLLHLERVGLTADPERSKGLLRAGLPRLEPLAQAGDPQAQYLMGLVEILGIEKPPDLSMARRWLERAADKYPLWACHSLGWMFLTGQGVTKDPERAIAYYRRAAEAGNVRSMLELGRSLLQGDRTRPLGEEVQWFRTAAQRGFVDAQWLLGDRLLTVPGGRAEDRQEAVRWLEAAVLRQPKAGYYLAAALALGRGTKVDLPRARKLFVELADSGDRYAETQAGWMEVTGLGGAAEPVRGRARLEHAAKIGRDGLFGLLGTSSDLPEERSFFDLGMAGLERQSRAGQAEAQGLLASILLVGLHWAEPDPVRAVALARSAAEHGQPQALRTLAVAYRRGLGGLEADSHQGAEWYRRAAEAGETYCMMWLSQMLFREEAAARHPREALDWLRRSGEEGNFFAIADLGNLYDEGWYGLPRDSAEALRWKIRAAEMGDSAARGWLKVHAPDKVPPLRQ